MTKRIPAKYRHSSEDIARAISLFAAVRRIVRTKLANGKKIDPTSWLCIETLKFVADHGKPRMKDIAEYLSITAPSTTSIVKGLVKSGFISYAADQDDRRVLRLALTAKGKAELRKSITRGVKVLSGLFAVLSPEEVKVFIQTLERLKS